ncbi:tripartite motif-containing protein 60-like [Dendropsophus ebraccatus]|uniref:tripartite motif-containing protein 60-like n=1 Tax=Dendropsophus ebraccatus TaxID=150705 RepID=UPI0038322A04
MAMMAEPMYINILQNNFQEPAMPICENIYYPSLSPLSRTTEWQKEVTNNSQDDTKVFCTYCVHMTVPAVKLCTLCKASLCNIHLQLHSKSMEHVLIDPMETFGKAKDTKCSIHKEDLKYYCIEDAICICVSCCVAGLHKKHQVVPLPEASERKKKDVKTVLEKLLIQQRENDVKVEKLQSQRKALQGKSSNLSSRVSDMFRDVRYQLDDLELRVLNEIVREENTILEPISLLIERLERQQDELSRNISLIKELCNLSDPLTVIKKMDENHVNFWHPTARTSLVSDPDDLDEGLILVSLQKSLDDIMTRLKRWHWKADVTLDVSTAANDIYVSGDKRTVSWSKINQRRQKNPERFKSHQVLSTQRFSSGRHYWEIEVCPSGKWTVGLCYPSMDRKGETSFIGNNDKSWGLGYADTKYKAIHNRTERHLPSLLPCTKMGVYLDYEAGQLSFYDVSDVIRHIHTFSTTFTEPVQAIFWVSYSWMRVSS